MIDEFGQQIVDLYDAHVRSVGGDVKIADARDAIRADVAEMLAGTDRDLDGEADRLIRATLSDIRRKRSRSLKENLEYVLDGFSEDGTYVDPLLDQAYSLGDDHGIDKTLRQWSTDDFQHMVVTRYRVAADATKAAAEIDEVAQMCIDRMEAAGVKRFGDLA